MGIPYTLHDKQYREQERLKAMNRRRHPNKDTIERNTLSIRSSLRKNPLPWVKASGSPHWLSMQAATYLKIVDLENVRLFESPEMTLAKVVCNLRNYHSQDASQTVELIRTLYNPRMGTNWSPEGIRLVWELVEGYTPSLGLDDVDAVAKKRTRDLEEDVVDLIAATLPGKRVSIDELYATFREWNPDVETNTIALGRAITAVTGIKSKASKSKRYYSGFHFPKTKQSAIPGNSPDATILAIRKGVADLGSQEVA